MTATLSAQTASPRRSLARRFWRSLIETLAFVGARGPVVY